MLKTFSPLRLAFCAVCVLCLLGLQAYGQEKDNGKDQVTEHQNGVVQDWSGRHVIYPRVGEIHSLIAVQNDPRAILSWQAAEREDWHRWRGWHHIRGQQSGIGRDWSISLGLGTTAPAMYPAKYTFNVNAVASCVNDFVVFPVNVAGSTTQPNLVAFNDLYSGTTGGTGICNTQRQTYFTGTDVVSDAATYWSYNIKAADGVVSTSPALSLDGTRVAFVETGAGTTAHFHVLAWHAGSGLVAGDGVDATNAQNVLLPKTITTGFATSAPAAGSGTVTDLVLTPASGTASDTLSSPFVDYGNDVAYIGNDSGTLFKVDNVFCSANNCITGGPPAPTLDATWGGGTTGLVTGCPGKLSGAVVDSGTGNIFVGCSDGKLYGFTPAGAAITGSPLIVGNGSATGGIVDPPMVDVVRGLLYVVSGASAGGTSVLVQAGTTSFSSPVPITATLGAGGSHNLHAPAVNTQYFNSPTSTTWRIYEWALSSGGTNIELYGSTFLPGHVMNGGAPVDSLQISGSTAVELSPLTEFLNGSNDQVFVSGLTVASPNFIEYDMNNFPALFPNVFPPSSTAGATATETGGTTGIVVDNVSASVQASSIYFGTLGTNSAVKLTQSGLH